MKIISNIHASIEGQDEFAISPTAGLCSQITFENSDFWAGGLYDLSVGWFGIPGANGRYSTKTHLVNKDKPVCGAKINKKSEYQWCSYYKNIVPECKHCKKGLNLYENSL